MTTEPQEPAQATLPERLMAASTGTIEWRVADPETGSYCVAYSRADYLDPEREAREWLRRHRKEFPTGRFVEHEARRVLVQSELQRLAVEAAAEILRLHALLEHVHRRQQRA